MSCNNPLRDPRLCASLKNPLDVLAIKKTAGYSLYSLLRCATYRRDRLEDLKIKELLIRLESQVKGLSVYKPEHGGDATAMYLHERIAPLNIRVTRLARGLPVGGDLEYADQNTLLRALAGRERLE